MLIAHSLFAQSIKGIFLQAKNSEISLTGFNGYTEKTLGKTITDSLGNFELYYPQEYVGAAILQIKNSSSVIILLNHENILMQWKELKDFSTLQFSNSPENDTFSKGVTLNQETENKLAGLKFLLPQYEKLPKQQKWLRQEIVNQEQQFSNYLHQLPKNSYAKYYLKIRKLITDFPLTANRYIERMPQHEVEFNALDFSDEKLSSSGLLKELLEGYFKLMESHLEPQEMYAHINSGIDALLKSLETNSTLQQEVAQHLFNYFEKRSLFTAAEHLAIVMLNQTHCQLSEKSTNLFEQYRKLAVGKIAPNIFHLKNENDLKNLNNSYKLVVFGASWCPNCQIDYDKLKGNYHSLKEKYDVEVVYISIDTDFKVFDAYYKEAPFITYCDGKGWDTQAAKDYHVFATPTYMLLDKELNIVAKINSPEHLEAWLANRIKRKN